MSAPHAHKAHMFAREALQEERSSTKDPAHRSPPQSRATGSGAPPRTRTGACPVTLYAFPYLAELWRAFPRPLRYWLCSEWRL